MPGPKKPGMTEDAKNLAVTCFARFMGPTQVAEAVNERYGKPGAPLLDKRTAQHYDPTVRMGKNVSKKRRQLFDQVRAHFVAELEAIPIANRAMRLQQLQLHYDKMIGGTTPNIRMALEILEKAAKEAGGVHTNETRVHHSGSVKVEEVTEDEMRNGLAAAIAQALEERRAEVQPTKH